MSANPCRSLSNPARFHRVTRARAPAISGIRATRVESFRDRDRVPLVLVPHACAWLVTTRSRGAPAAPTGPTPRRVLQVMRMRRAQRAPSWRAGPFDRLNASFALLRSGRRSRDGLDSGPGGQGALPPAHDAAPGPTPSPAAPAALRHLARAPHFRDSFMLRVRGLRGGSVSTAGGADRGSRRAGSRELRRRRGVSPRPIGRVG